MVSLIAKKDMRYASRDLRAGERFDASEKDAEILKGVGHADEAGQPPPGDDAAASALEDKAGGQSRRKSRTYNRRDLLAEGSEGAE